MSTRMHHCSSILSMTLPGFIAHAARHGWHRARAQRAYHAFFRSGAAAPDFAPLPDLTLAHVHTEPAEACDAGDTPSANRPVRKFLLRDPDGLETESVLLPQTSRTGRQRTALCVSSQIGCAMGCTFCETAQMGRIRQLSATEIVAQWHAAAHLLGERPDNIVFMGMGEPMDNLDAVLAAVAVLIDHGGPAIPASRITVSTVGRPDGIDRLADACEAGMWGRVHLALSLNAPNDEIRSTIMPVNRAAPMAALRSAIMRWNARRKSRVLVEYVLIPGVNDADAHAREVCTFLRGLAITLNVIPYNPRRNSPWPAPEEANVRRFVDLCAAEGIAVRRRITLGRKTMAACGQLGNELLRRPARVSPDRKMIPMGINVPGAATR